MAIGPKGGEVWAGQLEGRGVMKEKGLLLLKGALQDGGGGAHWQNT